MVTNPRSWSLAMLLSAASANADTTLQFASQGDCPAFADSVQVSGALVRADIRTQGQDYASIFDGSVNSLTTLLPAQHKYYQVQVDESAPDYTIGVANGTGNLIDSQMQKMQAMLQQQCTDPEKKGGSCDAMPDLRSVMQGIAASRAKTEMRDTGHKKTLAGVDCDVFEVLEDDVKKQEVCYALANELPISDDDRKGLALGLKVMGHVGQAVAAIADNSGVADSPAQKQDGLPVAQTCFDAAGQAVGQATMTITQDKIAPERFDIPSDYAKMSLQDDPAGH